MLDIIMQAGVAVIGTGLGTVTGLTAGKISRKATAKAIKPEAYATQEEFQKAFKKRSFRNNAIATGVTVILDAAIGAGAAYVITDVIPGMNGNGDTSTDGGDTSDSGEAALI